MAKFRWSEIFLSIEGEAKYSGWPTVYIRFAGCNFECRGFNNPDNVEITNEVLGFDPADFTVLKDLPVVNIGCDSIYSWDMRFKHLWDMGDENKLAEETIKVVPHESWYNPVTRQPVILSLTGGEPTLRTNHLEDLLRHPLFEQLQYLLIETNCSIPLREEFLDYLRTWALTRTGRTIIWSNSPKLSCSGESWDKAIRPEVAIQQKSVWHSDQYFKFVCGASVLDFDVVAKARDMYYEAGIHRDVSPVYIMPMACTEEQQDEISAQVALMCLDRGYIYCHRIHNSVFGNEIGT